MKRYNEGRKANRTSTNREAYERRYRAMSFYMNPKQPRLLTARDVAHLLGVLREEVINVFYEGGRLKCTRFQNGIPRFWAEDVFDFAKREGMWNDDLAEYAEELDKIIEMKERDPEKYLELCNRLQKARKVLEDNRQRGGNIPDLGEAPFTLKRGLSQKPIQGS